MVHLFNIQHGSAVLCLDVTVKHICSNYCPDSGAEMELLTQDNTAGEEPCETPERSSVEALLDISEENFLKELEPYEYHCYSGWEEAVCGWARVAPLSCILVTQKTNVESKREADKLSPFEPTPSTADSATTPVQQRCESRVSLHNVQNSTSSQQKGFWRQTAVATQKANTAERPVLNAIQKNIKTEGTLRAATLQPCHVSSKYSVPENRPVKPKQKSSPRPSYTVVSIKNLTFLPPVTSPHLNHKDGAHLCRGKKAPKGETLQVNCIMLNTKSGTDTGKRHEDVPFSSAPLTYRTHMSAVSTSVPRRFHTPTPPKPDIVYQNGYPVGKGFSQAIAQACMHPSCLFS